MTQVVEILRKKTEIPGSIFDRVVGNFQLTYSFYPLSVALVTTQPLTEMSTKEFP